jgi:hypothetical protein
MGERASRVRTMRQEAATAAEAAGGTLPTDQGQALQSKMDAVHGEFVAAALEYAVRGLSLRETAFVGGYAPLVFRASEWNLPGVPEPEKPLTGKKSERQAQAAQEAKAAREKAQQDAER